METEICSRRLYSSNQIILNSYRTTKNILTKFGHENRHSIDKHDALVTMSDMVTTTISSISATCLSDKAPITLLQRETATCKDSLKRAYSGHSSEWLRTEIR